MFLATSGENLQVRWLGRDATFKDPVLTNRLLTTSSATQGECFALLLSMTGHGEAHTQRDDMSVAVEVRTLNSRYFKLSVRAGECFLALEPRIETVVRKRIRRGTVQIAVRIDREATPDRYHLSGAVLQGYRDQLEGLCDKLHVAESVHLEALLGLPGVIDEQAALLACTKADWPIIEQTLTEALIREIQTTTPWVITGRSRADTVLTGVIEAAELMGDETLVAETAKIIGASSTTAEEAFLTAVRVRMAAKRGRRFLEDRLRAFEAKIKDQG